MESKKLFTNSLIEKSSWKIIFFIIMKRVLKVQGEKKEAEEAIYFTAPNLFYLPNIALNSGEENAERKRKNCLLLLFTELARISKSLQCNTIESRNV